jgi:hypothetical protein
MHFSTIAALPLLLGITLALPQQGDNGISYFHQKWDLAVVGTIVKAEHPRAAQRLVVKVTTRRTGTETACDIHFNEQDPSTGVVSLS